ncbi:uncharacterized protein CPUR_07403 [Claviceps purpurea 20.1]|uniref:Uncharacterized protein n=1 Tax=Claviceps purpurea (strain 20.1) TaxID=1111077 RepID=M1WFA9_CLAP2|nr:uncharacterized protein CPUR_07403 [Claviceps purpurea 20.1]
MALAASQTASALVGNYWTFSGNPPGGLRNVTFPFKMDGASHESGYHYAQKFNFEGIRKVGYCGIQNRPSRGNRSIVHALFSTSQGGATSRDKNCFPGANGGPGVSCTVDFYGSYDIVYNIVVENVQNTTWVGRAVNNSTGKSVHIGSWTLPPASGGIRPNQVGLVEYYPWRSNRHKCHSLPKTAVTMYDPFSVTPGAGTGSVQKPHEYGGCIGKVAFSTEKIGNGYRIQCGF